MTPVLLDSDTCLLSVVVVTRNEAATIRSCLESVLRECREIDAELILVDSASTDGTLECARHFPVRIARLPESPLLSPAVGRYVGTEMARGDFLLFLDGDMVLVEGWLPGALREFARPDLGGLCGTLFNVLPGETPSMGHPFLLPIGDVKGLGGGALYRAEALRKSGTFAPSMRGEEERELAHRLARHGFVVRRADVPMAFHFVKERTTAELDEKSKFFTGVGQALRAYPFQAIFWDLLRANGAIVGSIAAIPAGLLILIAGIAVWGPPAVLLAAGASGVAAGMAIAIAGWRRVRRYIRSRFLNGVNILRGFALGLVPPEHYMKNLPVVSEPPPRV